LKSGKQSGKYRLYKQGSVGRRLERCSYLPLLFVGNPPPFSIAERVLGGEGRRVELGGRQKEEKKRRLLIPYFFKTVILGPFSRLGQVFPQSSRC